MKFSLFFMKEIELEQHQKLTKIVQEKKLIGDFPGGPVVKTPLQRVQVQSLIGELRSCMLCGVAKKKKKLIGTSHL